MSNNCYVIDGDKKPLSPTKEEKAWYMIRKGKAKLVSRVPMVIQLYRSINNEEICNDEVRLGIDDGSLHTGIAIIQKGKKKNKSLLKGTIEHRKDVHKLMEVRKGYRRNRRNNKRYREKRFSNRASSRRKCRIAPSIYQKKQATLRVVDNINKFIKIDSYYLEDVSIDIRAMTDGYKPYKWRYQKSNRLDENIRRAVIMRDGCKCKKCGKTKNLEVHHIKPRRLNGSNTQDNLITLCSKCHSKTEGREEKWMNYFYSLISTNKSKSKGLNYAEYVMQGKNYLRKELQSRGELHLTTGADTCNRRNDWFIEKSHSNDALCITDLRPDTTDLKDWIIKPIRRKSKARTKSVLGFQHRDIISYTFRNGDTYIGYVTGLYPELNALNFQSKTKHCKKVSAKKCNLIQRPKKLYWL